MYCSALRLIDMQYPHFPVEKDFTCVLQSSGDLDQYSEGGRLWLLSFFTLNWQYLHVGGSLLPYLIKFYQWIHSDLAYLLTHEKASDLTIGQVVKLAEENLEKESGKHIRNLYEEVKASYNHYVRMMESAARDCKVSDDIPVVHFLTGKHVDVHPVALKCKQ